MYRLKTSEPEFTVVDGAFANHTYRAGQSYAEIPPEEANRFEKIEDPAPRGVQGEGKGGKE